MGTLIDRWGIEDRFHDAFGRERLTSDETRVEILGAMGVDPEAAAGGTAAHGTGGLKESWKARVDFGFSRSSRYRMAQ